MDGEPTIAERLAMEQGEEEETRLRADLDESEEAEREENEQREAEDPVFKRALLHARYVDRLSDAKIAETLGVGLRKVHSVLRPLGHHANPAGRANWARGKALGAMARRREELIDPTMGLYSKPRRPRRERFVP